LYVLLGTTKEDELSTLEKPISRAPSTGIHYATRKGQDELKIYSLTLPLGVVARDIARDFSPDEPLPGNRRVNAKRALEYADYVIERHRENRAHITPPVVMRATDGEVKETGDWVREEAQGITRGALEIAPRALRTADGQHRLYGAKKKLEIFDDHIVVDKLLLEKVEENGQEPAVIEQARKRLERTQEERAALFNLPVTVEIILVDSERVYQQLFADIANNAKGLGGDLTTWFDQTKVTYRIARSLVEDSGHPLLEGKVHVGVGTEDRLPSEGPHWIGIKTVADMVHAVTKGVSGRFSRKEEKEYEADPTAEKELRTQAERFLDCLVKAFPVIRNIKDGKPSMAGEVRKSRQTMLTSSSMLRALASAYYLNVLSDNDEYALQGADVDARAQQFTSGLATLADAMKVDPKAGLDQKNPIVKLSPSSFAFGGKSKPTAPTARIGNINALAQGIAQHVQTAVAK
jgi:hypothetical protein